MKKQTYKEKYSEMYGNNSMYLKFIEWLDKLNKKKKKDGKK